jgi:hypothetical protein
MSPKQEKHICSINDVPRLKELFCVNINFLKRTLLSIKVVDGKKNYPCKPCLLNCSQLEWILTSSYAVEPRQRHIFIHTHCTIVVLSQSMESCSILFRNLKPMDNALPTLSIDCRYITSYNSRMKEMINCLWFISSGGLCSTPQKVLFSCFIRVLTTQLGLTLLRNSGGKSHINLR